MSYDTRHFRFDLPRDLSSEAVAYIKEEHERGLKELENRLHVERDYGRKIWKKITVTTVPTGPNYAYLTGDRESQIEYNRGNISRGTIDSTAGPFVHEVTHHYVNHAGDFFSEGLAVYMQEHLGRNKAGPNNGADLHRTLAGEDLIPLRGMIGVNDLNREFGEKGRRAYLEAGSFVKYVIEDVSKGNTKPFMKFFLRDGEYKANFGKSFEELEAGWREKIRNTKPLYAFSDVLKVEHLNPRLKPTGNLSGGREALNRKYLVGVPTTTGGTLYPIWVDVDLESRAEQPIMLTGMYTDNKYGNERIGRPNYYVWPFGNLLPVRLGLLGHTLNPGERRRVADFPIGTCSSHPTTKFVVHYLYKIPNLSNDEFNAQVIMKKIRESS